ncbi:helix-turn-helix transcriptional regulator [Arthrobacter sp.]|uniref:ArsR/SmtB family transcription factor n=1 Tax=Arthrobacter sp. TaxID=1667 RepID=UPI0026E0C81C|nr:metalloregulator ArsR/SmtB family transcription factor [Arthrobacter sp.]MDO5751556.1 metalloregulator ArsR/SmtB family transcription factor [Arthrobacter sp.]
MVAEKVFAVIAETTRREILAALAQESKAVGQLVDELGVSQPTVSKHLRVMREAGVVTMRAQGQKRFYGINTEPLTLVAAWLDSLGAGAGAGAAVTSPELSETVQTTAPVLAEARVASTPQQPFRRQPASSATSTGATMNGTSSRSATPETVGADASADAPAVASAPGPAAVPTQVPAPVRVAAVEGATNTSAKPEPAPTSSAVAETSTPSDGEKSSKDTAVVVLPSKADGHDAKGDVQLNGVPAIVVQSNDHEGGVPGQISRSVGRAANKAADLLSNLPTFRRRKD